LPLIVVVSEEERRAPGDAGPNMPQVIGTAARFEFNHGSIYLLEMCRPGFSSKDCQAIQDRMQ
jgi:hypothetical protein